MSNTIKGGASLRLVAGLTTAALVISGVIAANLHTARLSPPTCTLSGRTQTDVAGLDVAKVSCTGMINLRTYHFTTNSANAGWDVSGSAGNGAQSTPFIANSSGVFPSRTVSGTSATWYVLTSNTSGSDLSSKTLLVVDETDSNNNATTSSITIKKNITATFATPLNPTGGSQEAKMTITNLVTNEDYYFKPNGMDVSGWSTATLAGDGTSGNGFTFGSGPGLSLHVEGAASLDVYFKTQDPGSADNTNAYLLISDDLGSARPILSQPDGTNNHITIVNPARK